MAEAEGANAPTLELEALLPAFSALLCDLVKRGGRDATASTYSSNPTVRRRPDMMLPLKWRCPCELKHNAAVTAARLGSNSQ